MLFRLYPLHDLEIPLMLGVKTKRIPVGKIDLFRVVRNKMEKV
jgi:hypothetical protein